MSLHIRISDTDIHYVRYESGTQSQFQFQTFPLRPQLPLTVNLRETNQAMQFQPQADERIQLLASAPVTLVPLAEFQEEDVTDTYNFCFTDDQKRSVFYDTVPAANVVLLFALAQNTCHAIEDVFGQVRYTSSLMPVVQHWATKGIDTSDSARVFVYSHEGTIDVAVFEEKRLLMLNSYRVHSLSDVIYFTFNLVRHLNLDLKNIPFFIAGTSQLRDPLVSEFHKYAQRVYPIHPTADFNRHPATTTEGVPYDLMCAFRTERK